MAGLPYTTPSGFTYQMPTDWKSLSNLMTTYLMAWQEEES